MDELPFFFCEMELLDCSIQREKRKRVVNQCKETAGRVQRFKITENCEYKNLISLQKRKILFSALTFFWNYKTFTVMV